MKQCALLFFAIFLVSTTYSQKFRKVKVESAEKQVKKTYGLLKSDPTILHGPYKCTYFGIVTSEGAYKMGNRHGNWKLGSPREGLYIEAEFYEGTKNGHFRFSEKGVTLGDIYYDMGKVDSLFAYSMDGALLNELRVDDQGRGATTTYYENGQIMEHSPIRNFMKNGKVKMFYENGQLFQEVIYQHDMPFTELSTYDETGNEKYGGDLENGNGEFLFFRMSKEGFSSVRELVTYKNSRRDGDFISYGDQGQVSIRGQYSEGVRYGDWLTMLNGDTTIENYINEEPYALDTLGDPSRRTYRSVFAYAVVEKMPEFPGGGSGLMNFIGKNITYPREARMAGVQGTTYVSFVIDELGDITEVQIKETLHSSIDAEIKRVLSLMPNWQPGFQQGIAVKVQYNLPIRLSMR